MRLSPENSSSEQSLTHKEEEVAYVLVGPLQLTLSGDEYEWQTGDSVEVPAHTEHQWLNQTNKETSILFSVTPPSLKKAVLENKKANPL